MKFDKEQAKKKIEELAKASGVEDEVIAKMCKAIDEDEGDEAEAEADADGDDEGDEPPAYGDDDKMEKGDNEGLQLVKSLQETLESVQTGANLLKQEQVDELVKASKFETAEDFSKYTIEAMNLALGSVRERIGNLEKGFLAAVNLGNKREQQLVKALSEKNDLIKSLAGKKAETVEGEPAEKLEKSAPIHQPAADAPRAVKTIASPMDEQTEAKAELTRVDVYNAIEKLSKGGGLDEAGQEKLRKARIDFVDFVPVNQIVTAHGEFLGLSKAG